MSRERRPSFDRTRQKKLKNKIKSNGCISEKFAGSRQSFYQQASKNSTRCRRCDGGGNEDGSIEEEEFLDDVEQPAFYDTPPNSSFDKVMCIMATPPALKSSTPTAAEKLDSFRAEVAEIVELDDLRKQMVSHTAAPEQAKQGLLIQGKDLCHSNASAPGAQRIPPLPEDPYVIPSPPKNPRDVIAMIRRARAIGRLKALEEAKAHSKLSKYGLKPGLASVRGPRKSTKQVLNKPTVTKVLNKSPPKKTGAVAKKRNTRQQQRPEYVSDEWAAAVLRARNLAGLKTSNPKLLPKPKARNKSESRSLPHRPPAPTPPKTPTRPKTPTFENILQRVAVMRSRDNTAQAAFVQREKEISTSNSQELEEFEILEQLYGAVSPSKYATLNQGTNDLKKRIQTLQQQILQTPPRVVSNEINNLMHLKQFSSTQGAEVTSGTHSPAFDNEFLQNIDIPEFDINDIPLFAFSPEALANAGFEMGDEVLLAETSMPDLDEDVSLDVLELEDISSPELYDLSISGNDLAIEPDYPLELSTEDDDEKHEFTEQIEGEETPKQSSFLASVVNAVVDGFKNIFTPLRTYDGQSEEEKPDLDLDTSLPNLFALTPPPKRKTPPSEHEAEKSMEEKRLTDKSPVIVPPHPKDPKDYKAMVKRAQVIQRKKAKFDIVADPSAQRNKKGKGEIKSTLPKRVPLRKKKIPLQKKTTQKLKTVYQVGEYSPSDMAAVARARKLAGLKNLSALLKQEPEAKVQERKAASEAEILFPAQRIREKMKWMRNTIGELPRPSIESLGTLEAIRASLPKPVTSKRKWRPTGRLRADHRVKPSERIFRHDFGRVFDPAEKGQKRRLKTIDVMSPITEETQFSNEDLMIFSPLKPHEGKMRLRHLKEQAAKRTAQSMKDAEEQLAAISFDVSSVRQMNSPKPPKIFQQISPIELQSPSGPTKKARSEKVTKVGPHRDPETIREEITENEQQSSQNLSDIDSPDFMDISDIRPPKDTSIPTPAEIIERIRLTVLQKLKSTSRDVSQAPKSSLPISSSYDEFPQDLPDEQLCDIRTPEFEKTPKKVSPTVRNSSVERDRRMYAWGELPPTTPPQRIPTPKISPSKLIKRTLHSAKPKSPERIVIPPHPKDPKDYKAMIKRAQIIQKLKKQEEALATKVATLKQPPGRVAISRCLKPPPKDAKSSLGKRLVLKKRAPKISPKKSEKLKKVDDTTYPSEPPPLPQEYREAVARARLLHGLKNRTAALNPAVAVKLAAEEAAQAAYNALPEVEKIRKRMERLRKIPARKRRFEPSSEILGTLAAIRDNMPPVEDSPTPTIVTADISVKNIDENQVQSLSLQYASSVHHGTASPATGSVRVLELTPREYENSEAEMKANVSLDEFEALEAEFEKLYGHDTPKRSEGHWGRQLTHELPREAVESSHVEDVPALDAMPALVYSDPIKDFRITAENILETSQLMLKTPPRNIQERIQRLKEAQEEYCITSKYAEEALVTPVIEFSPIRLISPSGDTRTEPDDREPTAIPEENEWLLNIDKTPERLVHAVKRFRDLEDLPFDELEYEVEPSLIDISYEKPLSPPPRPSDIISKITHAYHQKVKGSVTQLPPKMLNLLEELPDEQLSELSAPSFTQTPITPTTKYSSPRIYLPIAWGESLLVSPHHKSTPIAESTLRSPQMEKIPTPEIFPAYPKEYVAMVKRAQAIYNLNKQQEAESVDKAPLPKPLKKERVPISRWQGPPHKKVGGKPRKKLVLRKCVQKSDGLAKENEYPSEPPPLPREYKEAVARARLLHGLKNRTAALNPKLAMQLAAKKAAEEAAIAAYNALPDLEKIKVRMERTRKDPHRKKKVKPTMEHVAYLEALKQTGAYGTFSDEPKSPKLVRQHANFRQLINAESRELAELAEFETLEKIFETPTRSSRFNQSRDKSLAEFEALESLLGAAPEKSTTPSNIKRLATPPRIDPRERFKHLIAQRRMPTTPIVKTPEIKYSPITLSWSPSRAEKSTAQTKTSAQLESIESLEGIQEPSFVDTTPLTPIERPRPRDIIDRIRRKVSEFCRPEVPTGQLIELRTPPHMLSLPSKVPEENLSDLSFPAFVKTPSKSPTSLPPVYAVKSPEISIPQLFEATPSPSIPNFSPMLSVRRQAPSPEDLIVIPPHPKDPTDYKAMVKRARQIQRLIEQNEAKIRANEATSTAKSAKKRVPISRCTAPPPRKPEKRKKLIMRNRKKRTSIKEAEYEPLPLPEYFAKEVALARTLAGFKTRTEKEAEAIKEAKQAEVAMSRSPIKDYIGVLARIEEMKKKGAVIRVQPSLASAAYLDALKGAMRLREDQQSIAESPQARYQKILAARRITPPSVTESPNITLTSEDIRYSPIRFVSPSIDEDQIDLLESEMQPGFRVASIEGLSELEELSEFDPPSCMDFSQYQIHEDQYASICPPQTPPPLTSDIINRIRQKYTTKPIFSESLKSTPVALEFPDDLPEDLLFDLSEPSFVESPAKSDTPIRSPNVKIPHYFEESLLADKMEQVKKFVSPRKSMSHKTDVTTLTRAKLQEKEMQISKKAPARSKKEKLVLKKKESKQCPAEPPKLPAKYLAEVAKARTLAGLKSKSVLSSKEVAKQSAVTAASSSNVPGKVTSASYANIMERVAALTAAKKLQGPTARERTHRQHLINLQQMQERKRLLQDLEQLRRKEGFKFDLMETPLPAKERLEAIKSRIITETPTVSEHPFIPVKTPELIEMPQYQPLELLLTPPYQFLENVSIPDLEDTSMPHDDLDNYTADEDDIEFQLAEIAAGANPNINRNYTSPQSKTAESNFDVAERIKVLQQQLLASPGEVNASNHIVELERTETDFGISERINMSQYQLLKSLNNANANALNEILIKENKEDYDDEDEQYVDEDEQYDQQDRYGGIMDDFEEMERKYL